MGLFELQDRINIANAEYLLKLPSDYIKDEIYKKDEVNESGDTWDFDTYIDNLKKWLNVIIKKKGVLNQKYKYSKKLKNCGRQYVSKFGVQSLQNDLKGFLCSNIYNDFDMVNAHPTILLHIKDEYFESIEMPLLEKYVNNRKAILDKWNITKKEILINLNNEKPTNSNNEFLKGIDIEFKKIQNALYTDDRTRFADISKSLLKKENKKGGFISRVLCIFENEILSKAVKLFNNRDLGAVIFDGLFIDTKLEIDLVLDKLNNATLDYGITWINKPLSNKLTIDDDLVLPVYEDDYTIMKNDFELEYFMINEPLLFGRERIENNKKIYYLYSKTEMNTLTATYQIANEITSKPESFFNRWIIDSSKRFYEKQIFIPNDDYDSSKYYNLFTGFNYSNDMDIDITSDNKYIKFFEEHIKLLCNNDITASNYLIKYIADLIQNPDILPGVAIVMCGGKGVGKDLLIDILIKLIGHDYTTRTQSFNSLFGNFNSGVKNKLLIQLNEVSGNDGYKQKEDLKVFLTQKTVDINEKMLKPYTLNNYARLFMCTNNNNPVEITPDNRRYFVIEAGEKQQRCYYDNMYDNVLGNEEAMNTIFNYLYKYDLTGFKLCDFPITNKMKRMMEHNVNPIYYFLKDKITESGFINCKTMFYMYTNYLECEGYSTNNCSPRSMKSILVNIPNNAIISLSKKVNGKTERGYNVNHNNLDVELLKIVDL